MAKYVIIGGVAGGATAAARLRRLDETADIVILERGDYVSYANCGLPYYAGGTIKEREALFLMTPARFAASLEIEVRTGHQATAIDRAGKIVTVAERANGRTYQEPYDALVLAPGAEPLRPPLPGIADERIFTLRSVPDIDAIKRRLDTQEVRRAVIVGAGFIGLEMADCLHARGVAVAIAEALPQVMSALDFEMAALLHQHLRSKGIELHLGDRVAAFAPEAGALTVTLGSGTRLPADLVLLAIGVRPDTALARAAGLDLDERGYLLTDAHMRTSDPSIYAVGDAVVVRHPITGRRAAVPLAGPANKQARIAADNIAGHAVEYRGAIGTAIAKVFDLAAAATGLSEQACAQAGLPCRSVIIHPTSHAGYYPGAKPLTLKVVFDPGSGKLLGAQAVGADGVDKRIDVLAAFLAMGATVDDLTEFEHAYAPPYGSAKDPVNYAGFVAQNLRSGKSTQVGWRDLEPLRAEGGLILDVRTPKEFAAGHIDGALNISTLDLRGRLADLPRDRMIVVYCRVGIRAYHAERILRQNGFTNVANLAGGWLTYAPAKAESCAGAALPVLESI